MILKCYKMYIQILQILQNNKCTIINRNKSICTLKEKDKLFLNTKNENDILLMQLLDTIHCTLYDTCDIGYKLSFNEINTIENKLKDKKSDKYIKDTIFTYV